MGLGNFLLNVFGSVAVQSASYYIEKIFDKKILKIINVHLVFLGIYIVALLIGKITFLNENLRLFITSSLILSLAVYSLIGVCKAILVLFKYLMYKGFSIFSFNYSIKVILLDYLLFKYKTEVNAYDAFKSLLRKHSIFIPDSNDVYEMLYGYLGRRLLIKATYYGVAILFIVFVLRPGAIHYLSDVKWYFLYITPFTISIDYVFGTNFTDMLMT